MSNISSWPCWSKRTVSRLPSWRRLGPMSEPSNSASAKNSPPPPRPPKKLNHPATTPPAERTPLKDEYVSVEHLLLAIIEERGRTAKLLSDQGVSRESLMAALQKMRGNQRVTSPTPEVTYQALERYGRDLTEARGPGQARSGHRPRRGDPPRHPGAVAAHQEQPGAHRRARRRQDRDRRGAGAAHRARRRARRA